jgi:uncharacterized protein YlxP (DUF503 family)
MTDQAAFAMLVCEFHIPSARSLKEKRRVVKSLVDRLHTRFRVSIAETAFHDLHQRAQISIAAVERGPARLERLLAGLRDTVDSYQEAWVVRWDAEIAEVEE